MMNRIEEKTSVLRSEDSVSKGSFYDKKGSISGKTNEYAKTERFLEQHTSPMRIHMRL